jgi:uncharacterized protein
VAVAFDPAKDLENVRKHGVALADFAGFDGQPVEVLDTRKDYGEPRFRSFGRIAGEPYCLVYTVRGDAIRLISFRRAHEKEMRRYGL